MLKKPGPNTVLRLALAQINPTVGDLAGNAEKILGYIRSAKKQKADIAVFPELCLTGYPPEDLVFKPQFISDNISQLSKISSRVTGIAAVVGFIDRGENGRIYNAAAILAEKKIVDIYHKIYLPNYGVFDEYRYFEAGGRSPVYLFNSIKLGINICEDIWHPDPARIQAQAGAEVIVNINASPYERGKPEKRKEVLAERSDENRVVIAYVNTVGGQDELVFDGQSMVFDHMGHAIARGKQFEEELMIVDIDIEEVRKYRRKTKAPKIEARPSAKKIRIPGRGKIRRRAVPSIIQPRMGPAEEVYGALVLGTSDYVRKNGFSGVVIGLSGGIDSSLVATVAVDAVGKTNVHGVLMPSRFTSRESREDAFELAANLGIGIKEIPIDPVFRQYLNSLADTFKHKKPDVTEENLQARIRGNMLMAMSNKFGWLVLTTGNKSEMSVGYATLYGDMAGGFAVIKDVPKTLVYKICEWKNSTARHEFIPKRVMTKEPTAELRPNQKDTDTLPPYDVLDPVLQAYVEADLTFEEILRLGCDKDRTKKVIRMVDSSEYKRRQAPPGVKITPRAFGRDRRFPITNKYRSY